MGLFNWFSKEKKPLANSANSPNLSSNVNASASNLIAVTPVPNVNSQGQQVQGQQGGKRSKSKKSKKAKSKPKKTKSRSRK